jgi:hypothetical protein
MRSARLALTVLASLAVAAATLTGCHKYPAIQSPTAEQGPPKRDFWEGTQPVLSDQSKVHTDATKTPVRVLFVGNSLTYSNGMPDMVARLAQNDGPGMSLASLDLRGKSLADHVADGDVAKMLEEKTWDFVVLQENSNVSETAKMLEPAKKLDEMVRAHGAKTVLFLPWAHSGSDAERQHMLSRMVAMYQDVGKAIGARVAPAGPAFEAVHTKKPEYDLVGSDGVHPTFRGSYVAACVLYATLYAKTPVGHDGPLASGLATSEVTFLQSTAWDVVQQKSW